MTETTTQTRTGKMYGGVDYEETFEVYENGKKFLKQVTFTKGERMAVVQFMHGNIPWGRSNAYMIPVTPEGKARSYKDRANARAKAYEYVCMG